MENIDGEDILQCAKVKKKLWDAFIRFVDRRMCLYCYVQIRIENVRRNLKITLVQWEWGTYVWDKTRGGRMKKMSHECELKMSGMK